MTQPLTRFINKLKQKYFLFSGDEKTFPPLLSSDEILNLLFRTQCRKKTPRHKHDIAHRQIGDSRSIYRGYGLDYEESRHYVSGDDQRYMNWRLTARTGQHFIKVFREEKQPGVFILLDRRTTMRFGTENRLKVTQAVRATAIAAFTAQQNNLSVGGVILEDQLEWFKTSQSKHAIHDFIHQSARPVKPIFSSTTKNHEKEINFTHILKMLNEILINGSKVYLISDFYDLHEDSLPVLLELASKHHLHALQITDPAELKLPRAGLLKLKSNNLNQFVSFDTNSNADSKRYQSFSIDHFSKRKKFFDGLSISYKEISTTTEAIENSF